MPSIATTCLYYNTHCRNLSYLKLVKRSLSVLLNHSWHRYRTTSVYKPHGFPVTFRLPSAAASSFISTSSSSSLVVALLHPRERQAAAPRCDGSSSVFNYRGGWEVCLSSDESMDERQRAERRRRRLGLEEVTSNARARLLIGGTQPGGGWKAFLKTFVFFQRFVITSVFCTFFSLMPFALNDPSLQTLAKSWLQLPLCPPYWPWARLHGGRSPHMFFCTAEKWLMCSHRLQTIHAFKKTTLAVHSRPSLSDPCCFPEPCTYTSICCRKISILFHLMWSLVSVTDHYFHN